MELVTKYTLLYAIVLMLVALGGMFSERSGIINIALEGIMTVGGTVGILMLNILGTSVSAFTYVTVSILSAIAAGVIYSALLAFSAINLKADQTIGGTALNLLATSLSLVIVKKYNNATVGKQSPKMQYSNSQFLFKIGNVEVSVFLIIGIVLLIIAYVLLYKTRFGLRLRACGEHPQAADSVGINVYKMRWAGVLISGLLGGLGGFAYIVPSVSDWNFEVGVTGMGFLALAVMIFGQWHPLKIAAAAVFFALFKSLANIYDSVSVLKSFGTWVTKTTGLTLTKEIYNMMPFLASTIVLALTSKNSRAPKAEGVPYDKGQR